MSGTLDPDRAAITAAEQIVRDALGHILCPRPGLPGATVERGPDKGRCRYLLRDDEPLCPVHGRADS
jgi:hypothetical protein